MGPKEIKKELNKLDKDKIIDILIDLYKKQKSVQEFFDFYLNPDERTLITKYKEIISKAFYPTRGNTIKFKDAKEAINNLKKLGPSPELIVELLLFYVENGIKFTKDYGDVNAGFYKDLAKSFVEALNLLDSLEILEKYEQRTGKIVDDTYNLGWGLNDYLIQVWTSFYPSEEED